MTLTIVQARMGSTRLPGKPLLDIDGKTVLEHVRDRLHECEADLGEIIVATTGLEEDWQIWREAKRLGLECFLWGGHPDDVLGRFDYVRRALGFTHGSVVRVTADCPFLDPGLLADVVNAIGEGDVDYVGVRGAPAGLHQEAFTAEVLVAANRWARAAGDREHVVPWMLRNGRCGWVDADIRGGPVELNTPVDLERLRRIAA